MDPNAALAELRALAANMPDSALGPEVDRMAELVTALDGWLTEGGFLPEAWDRLREVGGRPGVY